MSAASCSSLSLAALNRHCSIALLLHFRRLLSHCLHVRLLVVAQRLPGLVIHELRHGAAILVPPTDSVTLRHGYKIVRLSVYGYTLEASPG